MIKNASQTIIMGLGKTGLSCANFLHRKGELFTVMDSRENPPELNQFKAVFPEVPVYLGKFDSSILKTAKQLIVSPGISLQEKAIAEAIEGGVAAFGDIELFARHVTSKVVAITGSNAKSTVTTLVGELLKSVGFKVAVGGNLGTPALDLLLEDSPDYFILELSSFQLEETESLTPEVATILNVSPDHMDRYQTFAEYAAAKQRIYHQSVNQVFNRQDSYTYPNRNSNLGSFGLDPPKKNEFGLCSKDKEVFLFFGKTPLLSSQELLIKGQHNLANALAALAICYALGIPVREVLPALKKFRGLSHRCEFVLNRDGVSWYNDSKGTNVGAAVAALSGLGSTIFGKLIWIAGGIGKNADFSPLKAPVKQHVRTAILIGQDAKQIQKALDPEVEIIFVDSLQKAVEEACKIAAPHDAVLLSPACASFDMFRDFEHRGETFKHLVQQL